MNRFTFTAIVALATVCFASGPLADLAITLGEHNDGVNWFDSSTARICADKR